MNCTWKGTVTLLLTVLFITGFCSCNPKEKEKKQRIAVVISTLNNPWFVVLGQSAVDRCNELGYEATLFDSQNNPSKEAEHFDNILVSGYKAILFNPTDADGSANNAKAAAQAGVPVFCMDREINMPGATVTQILSDNYSGCITLGQYFVESMNRKGNYVEILGLVGDNNTWARSRGFHSVVDCYEGLKMVAQQNADFDQNKAMEVMESMMQAHQDIDAVFCGNDAMAMGAYQAILAAGKEGKIKVFGFDGADDCVNAIREGKVEATGMQFPKTMAVTAATLADKYIKGERNLPKKLPVAVDLVHKKNVSQYGNFGKLDQN
jgi:ribose transport system substrate-binding protein